MKKLVCLLLACMMILAGASALAAGKISVTQENFHYISDYWRYGYAYAKVENIGDKPIKVNAGVLEIFDADGEVITSTDYMQSYATYLQPGEYTYVQMYSDIEGDQADPDDYLLTLTGKSGVDQTAVRFPTEVDLKLGVVESWWTYNYMYATVTNNTDQPVYSMEVVLALLDAEGNILYVDSHNFYSDVAINPGSSVTIRKDIGSSFMDYFSMNGFVPASVDAIAYVIEDIN